MEGLGCPGGEVMGKMGLGDTGVSGENGFPGDKGFPEDGEVEKAAQLFCSREVLLWSSALDGLGKGPGRAGNGVGSSWGLRGSSAASTGPISLFNRVSTRWIISRIRLRNPARSEGRMNSLYTMAAAISSGLSPSRSNRKVTILLLCVCSWHSTTLSFWSETLVTRSRDRGLRRRFLPGGLLIRPIPSPESLRPDAASET